MQQSVERPLEGDSELGNEYSEETPSPEVHIYAVEQARTHSEFVTKQGFGISEPLDRSQQGLYYV
jgi:hypothetical protein